LYGSDQNKRPITTTTSQERKRLQSDLATVEELTAMTVCHDGNGTRGRFRQRGAAWAGQGDARGWGDATYKEERVRVKHRRRISPMAEEHSGGGEKRERRGRRPARWYKHGARGFWASSSCWAWPHRRPCGKHHEDAANPCTAMTQRADIGAARQRHYSNASSFLLQVTSKCA
jgi:hypothetical protein